MVTIDDVRGLTAGLPRSYEALVRGRVKFRVGRIVYLAFSRDQTVMGFAFPKEERDALVQTWPEKFMQPDSGDLRYNWVHVRLDAIDEQELLELVRRVADGGAERLAAASDDELRLGRVADLSRGSPVRLVVLGEDLGQPVPGLEDEHRVRLQRVVRERHQRLRAPGLRARPRRVIDRQRGTEALRESRESIFQATITS